MKLCSQSNPIFCKLAYVICSSSSAITTTSDVIGRDWDWEHVSHWCMKNSKEKVRKRNDKFEAEKEWLSFLQILGKWWGETKEKGDGHQVKDDGAHMGPLAKLSSLRFSFLFFSFFFFFIKKMIVWWNWKLLENAEYIEYLCCSKLVDVVL